MRTDTAIMECPGRVAYSECIRLAAEAVNNVDELRDATFLITGASGMVGGAIGDALGSVTEKNAFCENCGHKFVRDGKFCPSCGAKREV